MKFQSAVGFGVLIHRLQDRESPPAVELCGGRECGYPSNRESMEFQGPTCRN